MVIIIMSSRLVILYHNHAKCFTGGTKAVMLNGNHRRHTKLEDIQDCAVCVFYQTR